MIRFLCLCPTYNRPRRLLDESINNFLKQTHSNAFLLVYDDLGSHDSLVSESMAVITTDRREPGIVAKYNKMLELAKQFGDFDAIALWDDDDIYLPNHLEYHSQVLQIHGMSYPALVWSTYTGKMEQEASGGRFWASLAIKTAEFNRVGGFVDTERADFDQQSLGYWRKNISCGDPCEIGEPTYVFRWGDTGCQHSQFQMRSPDDTGWYQRLAVSQGV